MNKNLIKHTVENEVISQRAVDGYVNATAMCKLHGKLIGHYLETEVTKEFLKELSRSIGLTIDVLVSKRMTGANDLRGTWVHPYVAINLGQWLSPVFAVKVSSWIFNWMEQGISIDAEYQQFLSYKAKIKEHGSNAGRFLSSLRWDINPSIKKKERDFAAKRQISINFDEPKILN